MEYAYIEKTTPLTSAANAIEVLPDEIGGAYHYRLREKDNLGFGVQFSTTYQLLDLYREESDGTITRGVEPLEVLQCISDHFEKVKIADPKDFQDDLLSNLGKCIDALYLEATQLEADPLPPAD